MASLPRIAPPAARVCSPTRVTLAVKLFAILLFTPLGLSAAEEPHYVPIAFDQASGAKPLDSYKEDDAWSVVPRGNRVYAGTPFEVQTKLQLAGNTDSRDGRLYVARSLGIPVGRRLARLHLLHTANIHGVDNQPVAALRLHYSNGATQTLFVTYGVHVRDFYKDFEGDAVSDPNSQLVWTGRRAATSRTSLRVYKTTFTLHTNSPLEQIDVFSLFEKSSHALFALTGETPDGAAQTAPTPSQDDSRYRHDLLVKVLDRDGQPINGARVRGIALDEGGTPTALGRMDDSAGEPSLVPVDFPASTRELRLVAAATAFVSADKVVRIVPGARFPRETTIRLDPGVRVGGFITDPDGQPVAEAKVSVYRVTHEQDSRETLFRYVESTTDKRGKWLAREVPEDMEGLRFRFSHPDFRTVSVDFSGEGSEPLTRRALVSLKSEFKFTANPAITGRVRDEKGEPLPNVPVTFIHTNSAGKDEVSHSRTDAGGRFNFLAVESGIARLLVRATNFSPVLQLVNLDQPLQPAEFTLKAGAPLKLRAREARTSVQPTAGLLYRIVTLTVPESPESSRSELRGEIIWDARSNTRGEAIWMHPMQGTPHAPAGLQDKVLVRATASGFHTAWTWVDPRAGEATVELHRYEPWRVRAIDAETRTPIPMFTTMNHNATNMSSSYGPATASNGEVIAGYFVEAWLKPRLLTIEASGYEKFRLTLVPELGATNTYELRRVPAAPRP